MTGIERLGGLGLVVALGLVHAGCGGSSGGGGGGAAPAPGSGQQTTTPPASSFTLNPSTPSGVAPFSLALTDTSTGAPTSWLWTFGDGNTSTQQHPTHVYQQPGTYTVTLVASNAAGQGTTASRGDVSVLSGGTSPGQVGSPFWYVGNQFGGALKQHTSSEAALAQQVLTLVNQERQAAGVAPLLQADTQATTAAKAHAEDMVGRSYFSHTSPEGWTPQNRLQMTGGSGFSLVGENIAVGQQTAQAVMTAWMGSSGHRANILDPRYTHLGVGVSQVSGPHWVQVFLRR